MLDVGLLTPSLMQARALLVRMCTCIFCIMGLSESARLFSATRPLWPKLRYSLTRPIAAFLLILKHYWSSKSSSCVWRDIHWRTMFFQLLQLFWHRMKVGANEWTTGRCLLNQHHKQQYVDCIDLQEYKSQFNNGCQPLVLLITNESIPHLHNIGASS